MVNEHRDERKGERFKAKLRKKKYCQNVLHRKYQTENATSGKDNSVTLDLIFDTVLTFTLFCLLVTAKKEWRAEPIKPL